MTTRELMSPASVTKYWSCLVILDTPVAFTHGYISIYFYSY